MLRALKLPNTGIILYEHMPCSVTPLVITGSPCIASILHPTVSPFSEITGGELEPRIFAITTYLCATWYHLYIRAIYDDPTVQVPMHACNSPTGRHRSNLIRSCGSQTKTARL